MYYRLFVSFEWERLLLCEKAALAILIKLRFSAAHHTAHTTLGLCLALSKPKCCCWLRFSLCFPLKILYIFLTFFFWERPRWRRRRYSRQQCCWWNLSLYLFSPPSAAWKKMEKIYVEIIILKKYKKKLCNWWNFCICAIDDLSDEPKKSSKFSIRCENT